MAKGTILLTGITGFIAKAVALEALRRGYHVRGSLRREGRAAEVRDALAPHLTDPAALDRLSFIALDLTRDAGWAEAMAGVDAVIHTASPFPLTQPKDEDELIRPAVDGALRALRAAHEAGVTRVVLTSSMEAVMHGHEGRVGPGDWSQLEAPTVTPYTKSKTLAEKAAWDFAAEHPQMQLTVINPGLVAGRPLDGNYGSSIEAVERFWRGRDPMVPDVSFPVVDVADVAFLHVEALERPATIGKRYPAADSFMSLLEIGRTMKAAYPARKIPTRQAPGWLLRIIARFDAQLRPVVPWLGKRLQLDNRQTVADFGRAFIPAEEAVLNSAAFLDERETAPAAAETPTAPAA